jgi:hypothetical protein
MQAEPVDPPDEPGERADATPTAIAGTTCSPDRRPAQQPESTTTRRPRWLRWLARI